MIRGVIWNWGPWLYNSFNNVLNLTNRIISVVHNEIAIEKEWIFLRNIQIPVYSSFFPNISSDTIHWSCTTNPVVFVHPLYKSFNEKSYKHISHLGFIVNIPDLEPIDLSEWINTVKWRGPAEPSVTELFIMWCCETGNSYFHLIPEITISIITEEGDEITKGLNDSPQSTSSTNEPRGNAEYHTQRSDSDRAMDAILSSSGC